MRLPFIVVLNKNDVIDPTFLIDWMRNFEHFQSACEAQRDVKDSFMGSLVTSMGLMLEEFYEHLHVVSCSSMTGDGMEAFMRAVEDATQEYDKYVIFLYQ
jgi:hypothetical protein